MKFVPTIEYRPHESSGRSPATLKLRLHDGLSLLTNIRVKGFGPAVSTPRQDIARRNFRVFRWTAPLCARQLRAM